MRIKEKDVILYTPHDFALDFVRHMFSMGFTPEKINLETGRFHRFTSIGCKKNCCEYLIFDGYKGGIFRCWRRFDSYFVFNPGNENKLSEIEKMQISRLNRERRIKQETLANEAALNAFRMLQKAKIATEEYPYVKRKKIIPINAFELDELLLIPAIDSQQKLKTVQIIYKDGFKKFPKYSALKGSMHLIGSLNDADIIFLSEGWATSCTIFMAISSCKITCISSFGASNLYDVTKSIRVKYNQPIIICADNDQWHHENIGVNKAKGISEKFFNVRYITPDFSGLNLNSKPTDYNDLYLLTDIDHVSNQILSQLETIYAPITS